MDIGALLLLFGGMGGLDDEYALDEEEEGGRVEELRRSDPRQLYCHRILLELL